MDEFLKAWNEIKWSAAPPPIEYRVYYDASNGKILFYTTESPPGEYILVDRDTFHCNRFDWTVEKGKMCPPRSVITKLRPDDNGTPCDARDITIIAQPGQKITHWKNHRNED